MFSDIMKIQGLKCASVLISGSEENYEMDLPEPLPISSKVGDIWVKNGAQGGSKMLSIQFPWYLAWMSSSNICL